MKPLVLMVVIVLTGVVGCTEQHLRLNTKLMVPTVSQIQTDQVLTNLVDFRQDGQIIPSQILLGGGGVQVSDQVSPTLKLFSKAATAKELDLGYQKQWVENWAITPVMDSADLRRLRALYRWAVGAQGFTPEEYPQVKKKDASGNPTTSDDPAQKFDFSSLGYPTWFYIDVEPSEAVLSKNGIDRKNDENKVVYKGQYEGHKVWVLEGGFTRFELAVLNATPNTASGGGGGGAKPKNQVFLQAQ